MRKLIPQFLISFYHIVLATTSTIIYGFPSRHLKVIGVTGTNGKTTTCHLIAEILERAGFKVGMATSIDFKVKDKLWPNNTKQSMQGRFRLNQLLRQMVKAGCQYAVIETTSEGIKQHRHLWIKYYAAIITNVTKDHLESHGGMDKYRQAKEKLFYKPSIHIVNLDMPFFKHFLKYPAKAKWGYEIYRNNLEISLGEDKVARAENIVYHNLHSHFDIVWGQQRTRVKLNLAGEFNIYNALASACFALSEKIDLTIIKQAFTKIKPVKGRLDEALTDRGFRVFVDYAHSEDALLQVYRTITELKHQRIIAVLGATGGGRDKAKRPVLGKLARDYCDLIFVTNEDPYDEDPVDIIDQVLSGVLNQSQKDKNKADLVKLSDNHWQIKVDEKDKQVFKVIDRKQAIVKALSSANTGDIVIITGKGAEEVMAVAHNKKIPFSDRKAVEGYLKQSDVEIT